MAEVLMLPQARHSTYYRRCLATSTSQESESAVEGREFYIYMLNYKIELVLISINAGIK
jgi:hypothetical protein